MTIKIVTTVGCRASQSNAIKKSANELYTGTNVFALPNGDTYVGDFCAHRAGFIWREGHGFYYTQDGHIYEGKWCDDKLVDSSPVSISYPNGDQFDGNLLKDKYNNSGEMLFKNGFRVLSNYKENKPVGAFYMVDTMGQLWRGMSPSPAQSGEKDKIFCRQEHVFFANIHPLRGIKKEKLKQIKPEWSKLASAVSCEEDSEESLQLNDRDLEQLVFGKKPKINSKIVWEDAPWYKNFLKYKETREIILSKIKSRQPLTEYENKWHCRYLISVKNRYAAMRQRAERTDPTIEGKSGTTLLHRFYSEEHKKSSVPYGTFYPSYYWHKHIEEEEMATEEERSVSESGIEEEYADEIIGESTEETEISEEEMLLSSNPTIGCSTKSLFDFVQNMTGAKIQQTCE